MQLDAEQCAARLLPQIIINTLTNDPLRQSSRADLCTPAAATLVASKYNHPVADIH